MIKEIYQIQRIFEISDCKLCIFYNPRSRIFANIHRILCGCPSQPLQLKKTSCYCSKDSGDLRLSPKLRCKHLSKIMIPPSKGIKRTPDGRIIMHTHTHTYHSIHLHVCTYTVIRLQLNERKEEISHEENIKSFG